MNGSFLSHLYLFFLLCSTLFRCSVSGRILYRVYPPNTALSGGAKLFFYLSPSLALVRSFFLDPNMTSYMAPFLTYTQLNTVKPKHMNGIWNIVNMLKWVWHCCSFHFQFLLQIANWNFGFGKPRKSSLSKRKCNVNAYANLNSVVYIQFFSILVPLLSHLIPLIRIRRHIQTIVRKSAFAYRLSQIQ